MHWLTVVPLIPAACMRVKLPYRPSILAGMREYPHTGHFGRYESWPVRGWPVWEMANSLIIIPAGLYERYHCILYWHNFQILTHCAPTPILSWIVSMCFVASKFDYRSFFASVVWGQFTEPQFYVLVDNAKQSYFVWKIRASSESEFVPGQLTSVILLVKVKTFSVKHSRTKILTASKHVR